jgi:hypothetical protein
MLEKSKVYIAFFMELMVEWSLFPIIHCLRIHFNTQLSPLIFHHHSHFPSLSVGFDFVTSYVYIQRFPSIYLTIIIDKKSLPIFTNFIKEKFLHLFLSRVLLCLGNSNLHKLASSYCYNN